LDEKKENNFIIGCVILVFVLQWISSIYSQKKTKKKEEKIVMGQSKWLLKMILPEHGSLTLDSTLGSFD
jgi:hypothetical protein